MVDIVIKAFYFIIIFFSIVFFHELGHFLLAKYHKIEVTQFMLGFGPKLIKFQKGETLYSLRAIPLGGAVMMTGEAEESDAENSYTSKTRWQRFTVLIAGPLMNFVFAFLILVIGFSYNGFPGETNTVLNFSDISPAREAGIEIGDKIVEIDGVSISSWRDLVDNVTISDGNPISVSVERNGEVIRGLKIKPLKINSQGMVRYIIGVGSRERDFIRSIKVSAYTVYDMSHKVIDVIPMMFKDKKMLKELAGPIGIANVVGEVSGQGLFRIIILTAFISINLGIMNLLPIVPLDGGKIFILMIEGIMRKPLNEKVENFISFLGIAFVLFLFVLVMYNDIARLTT